MYCYQPPLQHMYCPSQPPFHQVGQGQVGMLPWGPRIFCGVRRAGVDVSVHVCIAR